MKRPYTEDLLGDLMAAAYRNGVRLFRDACTLYAARAYPSAFALAVLAYEEVGKMYYVGRVCENMEFNPDSADFWYDTLYSGDGLRNHRCKQESALCSTPRFFPWTDPMWDHVGNGGLDREKQQALYVELSEDERVLTPAVREGRAYQMLEHVVAVLEDARDVAFCGFDDESNPGSQRQAAEQLAIVRHAFARCEPPATLKKVIG
jgi:AbiV family abortive infection protein